MSSKNVSKCVVAIEPISKTIMEEKLEGAKLEGVKEPIKKKTEKANGQEKDTEAKADTPTEAPKNGHSETAAKEPDVSKLQENGHDAKTNGKETPASSRPKRGVTNGVSDVALNSSVPVATPAVDSPVPEEDNLILTQPNPDQDNDELFPELNYDEASDNECSFDSSSPEFSPVARSMTRRSQAKKIPTPETPQLSSSKQDVLESPSPAPGCSPSRSTPQPAEPNTPLREKVLKLKEQYCVTPNRESPAPDTNSQDGQKDSEIIIVDDEDSKNESALESESSSTKTDTNFSKSRIKVSPYRRSTRISEQFSTVANYSGNNSTQETDIAGDISSSSRDRSPAADSGDESMNEAGDKTSSYSESFRHIKGRKSYRALREISLRNLSMQRQKFKEDRERDSESVSSANATQGSNPCDTISYDIPPSAKWTPVGHVVGRKRRQEEQDLSPASHASPALVLSPGGGAGEEQPSKRRRLLGYVTTPFRHLRERVASSTPLAMRHAQVTTQTFNTESLVLGEDPAAGSAGGPASPAQEALPMMADLVPGKPQGEHKWCSIM